MKRRTNGSIVPEPALRRLPWYLAFVKLLMAQGESVVSSTHIAKSTGVDSALVAKDLSYVSIVGKTRVGYDVNLMVEVLEEFLGFNHQHKAYLFGVGNLGAALLHDKGLSQYGMDIVGGFDVRNEMDNTEIGGTPVYHMSKLKEVMAPDVHIGILTVPVDVAQEVTDTLVGAGMTAIWNFTPFRISVPEGVVLQNTSIYSHLSVMFHRIEETTKP
ncbi:redox-sensing transcriptional repressor Rex [Porphyromonas levii]|uniref:Redox-sensing transcriptional repressor Rex n=1 Tax=Porphyromonas levii TaxID=28114 RepID=A0A4Y8WQQ2_9PORP|nr:redox-sensing transcriptional repressor Rex [Porphyromonas levii]MBR8702844.1 Redox-sensing transcriptional repressor Rex [Porphyromonas levii]MBR8713930.1 Redox-sensing transcriptional repressor Rex [Porphyromonas levii]MBR8715948.1 Redox-sensing transcriptional repressor Rex [Porphyromonas levii]MBR8728468.1 Redox-sensing transcriptional repressor Rex [Porphyromonas levii]MBR8728827.1 Redox-sensing transcriptional repressor Rex [Porphyromonas levii]